MKLSTGCAALTILLSLSGIVCSQADFFFTFERGGDSSLQSATFNVGDSGSLWIYWSTNGPADSDLDTGAFLDIMSSKSGVLEFTHAETFDWEILIGETPISNRWTDLQGGGGSFGETADSITADFIDELHAFTFTGGPGIIETNNGSGAFLDAGYFPINDAFEFGRIDFNVIGEGQTTVTGEGGNGGIINGPFKVPAQFNAANIVAVKNVPEPGATTLIMITMAGWVLRRRKPSN